MRNVILFILLTVNICHGQDTSAIQKILKNFDFDIAGTGYYQLPSKPPEIILPVYIKNTRQLYNGIFNREWTHAQDNPLFHGAYFVTFNTKYHVNENITLWASLIAEDRGWSYGVNNTYNSIVYSQIKLDIVKNIPFLGDTLQLFGSVGNLMNPRLYEGLTIYNMYQQGSDLHIKWNQFQFRFFHISDLVLGIGLRIDDSYNYISSFEKKVNKNWLMNIQSGYSFYPFFDFPYRNIFNLSMGLYKSSTMRLYAQASYRPNSSYYRNSEMLAGVAGMSWKKRTKKIQVEGTIEGRYYGSGFNENFYGPGDVLYRDLNKGIIGNTIGQNLYPLMLYDRPFSQWTVFTEYQFKNVAAITWQMNSSYFVYKNFIIKADLDFNYMFAENESPFLYSFYNAGMGWQEGNNLISAGFTNLDVHYPTFYMYKYPVFMVTLKRNLNENWFEQKH